MSLTREVEERLRTHRLPGLEGVLSGEEFVFPHYQGYSIANLPATIAAILGARLEGAAPPIPSHLWSDLATGVRRVLLVLVDAVGYEIFRALGETDPTLRRLLQAGRLLPLTSVFPSTTVVALTTMWTGRSPLGHGFVGTRLLLSEQGVVADMLALAPAAHKQDRESLLDWGWKPEQFVTVPSLGKQLNNQEVQTVTFTFYPYINGGLSRIFHRDAGERRGYVGLSDLWIGLREVVARAQAGRLFVNVYWGEVDAMSHVYGPGAEPCRSALRHLMRGLEEDFLSPLPPSAREGTLLLIVADHGQTSTPAERAVYLTDHPALQSMLLLPPTGEPRASFLYVQPGQKEQLRSYIAERFAGRFVLLETDRALAAGLFGPEQPTPALRARLGDFLLLAQDDSQLLLTRKQKPGEPPVLVGHHGSLSAAEMLVPLLMVRLDGV
ncbi:MAG TPA: alkaline phosphatase family protein [Thermoflexia bacterium]|nr:alkaline phosphatase family protein [Thermoflexia bacterium]